MDRRRHAQFERDQRLSRAKRLTWAFVRPKIVKNCQQRTFFFDMLMRNEVNRKGQGNAT